ncbi:MAG: hypothetical protein A3C50_02465 [Candidatus Staskawiczbacteria bacterium RIFCSPHIGHO2_02_FULL_43_16]|uniref:Uncharacterized protein n=1 Tax=Candidatus Staskawiczbacteria bacterium RIFCSPHIGHO2_01_FULL_41_41 TaxID=1802203 RepID=A0A1G2HV73_9BACT|nr:MAG: hypothetical protein A2822_01620 [Candidatus Staskawiczbacteria bacterium RIFCSPHIGHO2_01_FULL_41_41]OGZ68151.1 MAG: hypothetical protein A3C50_02465 [Candidatus Staskawiczbacteria bacterium RIFCSPHIGHO2_02_FULL_43_16]
MTRKIVLSLLTLLVLIIPGIGLAAGPFGDAPGIVTNPNQLPGGSFTVFFGNLIGKILDVLWIVFIAFAIIMFIVAGFQFLAAQGEPDGVGKARKFLLWGVIGVLVAVAAFTIPFFIRNTISPVATCNPPCEPGFVCTDGICFVGGGGI